MKTFRFLVLLQVFLLNLFLIKPILAYEDLEEDVDYSSLRLNEVMPNPDGSDGDYEWVEIYTDLTDGMDVTDLTDCRVDAKAFPEDTIIESGSYLVIAKDLLDKDGDGQSFEQRWGNNSGVWGDDEVEDYSVVEMNISMKNSDDSVIFECGNFEDEFFWEVADSGQSFSIDEDGEWTDEYLVTPGKENQPVPEIIYPHTILITEVYPTPQDEENEWIELYNFGEEEVDLTGWYMEDSSKKERLEDLKILRSKTYLVLEKLSLTLNNSGETLILYDPSEEEVDVFEYLKTDKGISNIREFDDSNYLEEIVQSKAVTKGGENTFVDPKDLFYKVEVVNIKEARNMDIGENVCVQGIVTSELGLLGSKISYIQDEKSGIQIYLKDESFWDDYKIGDEIKLIGELKEIKGELRIYVREENAIQLISNDKMIEPKQVEIKEIGESLEGSYVFVAGEIIDTSGKSFYIDDGTGEVKILIKSSTGIETPEKKKGQHAGVIGIVSQYGDDENSYRVLPRYASDILISDEPVRLGDVLAGTGQVTCRFVLAGTVILFFLYSCYVLSGKGRLEDFKI